MKKPATAPAKSAPAVFPFAKKPATTPENSAPAHSVIGEVTVIDPADMTEEELGRAGLLSPIVFAPEDQYTELEAEAELDPAGSAYKNELI
jgi:hypothetical protein